MVPAGRARGASRVADEQALVDAAVFLADPLRRVSGQDGTAGGIVEVVAEPEPMQP